MRTNNVNKIISEEKCPIIFEIWLVKFQIFSCRVVYFAQYSMDFNSLGFNLYVQNFSDQNK